MDRLVLVVCLVALAAAGLFGFDYLGTIVGPAAPLMTPRQQRALNLVASGALANLVAVDDSHWLIPSQNCEGAFFVTSTHDCSCPDMKFNHAPVCKHQVALRIQRVLDACAEDAKETDRAA